MDLDNDFSSTLQDDYSREGWQIKWLVMSQLMAEYHPTSVSMVKTNPKKKLLFGITN